VWLDLGVILIFVLAYFRLKYYEKLTVQDLRQGSMRAEDFTVHLTNIPLS
jgi:hypothetical protein